MASANEGLDKTGLAHLWDKIKQYVAEYVISGDGEIEKLSVKGTVSAGGGIWSDGNIVTMGNVQSGSDVFATDSNYDSVSLLDTSFRIKSQFTVTKSLGEAIADVVNNNFSENGGFNFSLLCTSGSFTVMGYTNENSYSGYAIERNANMRAYVFYGTTVMTVVSLNTLTPYSKNTETLSNAIITFNAIEINGSKFIRANGYTAQAMVKNNTYTIGNLSEKFRPTYFTYPYLTVANSITAALQIGTNGDVKLTPLSDIAKGTAFNIHFAYM